jgi:hypothetical protein
MAARAVGTPVVCTVAFGVGEDARVYLRRFSSGMATSTGRKHERRRLWTSHPSFLEASSSYLFSYHAGFASENLRLVG